MLSSYDTDMNCPFCKTDDVAVLFKTSSPVYTVSATDISNPVFSADSTEEIKLECYCRKCQRNFTKTFLGEVRW